MRALHAGVLVNLDTGTARKILPSAFTGIFGHTTGCGPRGLRGRGDRPAGRRDQAHLDLRAALVTSAPASIDDPFPVGTSAPPPEESSQKVAPWWNGQGEWEQRIEEHPEWIGNLDGVAAWARDRATRSLVDTYPESLLGRRERPAARAAELEGKSTSNDRHAWTSVGEYARAQEEAKEIEEELGTIDTKLTDLQKVAGPLERTDAPFDPRQLRVLDVTAAHRLLAATAVGDLDEAGHVAVLTPR